MNLPMHYGWGVLEEVQAKHGMVVVKGWAQEIPIIVVNDVQCTVHRTFRPDVAEALQVDDYFYGFMCEGLHDGQSEVLINGELVSVINDGPIKPDYHNLLTTQKVCTRDDIYSFGPPVDNIAIEVEKLIKRLNGSILDFGCGRGKVVQSLRNQGIDVHGIEIDRPEIRNTLAEDVYPYITLYNGNFPTPYTDRQFDNIICVEVLEHIPEFRQAIKEFHRIVRNKVIITVPDISAIPRLHKHGVVPWHMLESTHVNFFTQHSLHKELSPYFSHIDFVKICPMHINGDAVYTNLVAICTKSP